jgi:hypothetical protein
MGTVRMTRIIHGRIRFVKNVWPDEIRVIGG